MKKISAIIFALVLAFCLLSSSAFAVGALPQPDVPDYGYSYGSLPQPDGYYDYGTVDSGWSQADNYSLDNYTLSSAVSVPVISAEPNDVYASLGYIPAALQISAYAPSGGDLHYQWYAAYSGSNGAMTAIPGAYSSTYTPPQSAGTTYYCVGVCATVGNLRSAEVLSRVVTVNYSGIEVISAPSRTSYTQGESVNLNGLVVRVYDEFGTSWDSYNGSGLSVYPSKLDSVGTVPVSMSYGMSSATFYVNVRAASGGGTGSGSTTNANGIGTDVEHTHEYGEWEVTKEATCVTTGIQQRTCSCGDVQTEVIPRTDHTWDEGVITKQPTETSNGSRLYTCTVCKANKSEIIPAGTDTTAPQGLLIDSGNSGTNGTVPSTAPATPTMPTGTVGGNTVGAGVNANSDGGTINNTSDGSGWWLIPVSALLLVVCGSGAYYLMKKKSGE